MTEDSRSLLWAYQGIDWRKLEVGKTYQYEEGIEFQCDEVEIISIDNKPHNYGEQNEAIQIVFKVLKPVVGYEKDEIVVVGKVFGSWEYITRKQKFKPVGAEFDYSRAYIVT